MRYKLLSLSLAVLTTSTFCGCKKDTAAPPCYAGKVVGLTCFDGMLINVDPAYRIGVRATRNDSAHSVLGTNVISVVNTMDYGRLATVGLTLHFNAVNDPNRQHSGLQCFAADGVQGGVPRLVLGNVSTMGCQEGPR
ncbi:hypothetical protein [Hymenobacter negativus]|uniref:Lipoprotein n=1 Tax=Hymenobacter negativus TaxID=2795026 RepID=A0ABS3QHK2_9BACT|nr:hypothetical protein [Hymenobacter negativus]MBO2010642.1 hypothetical protein [Hymenobacter negativus]